MKKFIATALALCLILSMAACGGSNESSTASTTDSKASSATVDSSSEAVESGTTTPTSTDGSILSVCLASEPDTIDPALNSSVDGATMVLHLFSGIAKWAQDANGNMEIVPDCATDLPEGVENEDGTVTYTYTLRDDLKWSDGKALTAGDFEFAWKRAASVELAADYGYMFDVVDGYAAVWETDDDGNAVNPDAELNVKALDDKTIEITLINAVPYWEELLAFPAYLPVREDVVSNEAWATDPSTYVSNGPYVLDAWEHNSVITLKKNENYYDADSVTLETLECYLSDDQNNMLTNFENGSWQLIDDVPTNEIASLKTEYPDEFVVAGQIGTYYTCWNINENILPASSTLTGAEAEKAKAEIRNAIALLFDRNYIVEEISQGGQVPASSFVAMGMTNPDGTQFYETANSDESSFTGYYDVTPEAMEANFASCVETLKKYYTFDEATSMFTDFPGMTYLYNTSEGHKAIGEYLQSAMAAVGINIQLENQEWNTFLNTRKEGGYSIARNGWLADYNDPISFLDMWITSSGNNDVQFGRGEHAEAAIYNLDLTSLGYETKVENGTWAETYDVLITTIKACTDQDKRYEMMHIAEDMLMETGAILPLYFYTDLYMLNSNVEGFFSNPLGYKYFMYCTISE